VTCGAVRLRAEFKHFLRCARERDWLHGIAVLRARPRRSWSREVLTPQRLDNRLRSASLRDKGAADQSSGRARESPT
jgi:hypothetical protein